MRAEAGVLGVVALLGLLLGMNAPVGPSVVVLASAPARPAGACAQTLQGARVAAKAVGGALETFAGASCGVSVNGVAETVDWSTAGQVGAEALVRRGVRSAHFVGSTTDTSFTGAVRAVLPEGDDAVFVLDRDALASAPTGPLPVVLAPWLLDAGTLRAASAAGLSVLVAAHRDPTDPLAIDYRDYAMRFGVTPSAAGFEGFVRYLAAVGGRGAARAQAGLFAVSTVGVMPADLGRHGHGGAGWIPGAALIRV